MKLTDMTIIQFHDTLASNAPAPGGGSAAALSGALGAALTGMVAELTINKKKYLEYQPLMQDIIIEANKLRQKFLQAVDQDTEAFNMVGAVFSMPKNTDDEKTVRDQAMQDALKKCTCSPYNIMCYCLEALELIDKSLGKTNSNVVSDLGVAALSLKSAVQGAWLNILINIGGIKDEAFVAQYRNDGKAILSQALLLADKIYESVETSL